MPILLFTDLVSCRAVSVGTVGGDLLFSSEFCVGRRKERELRFAVNATASESDRVSVTCGYDVFKIHPSGIHYCHVVR